MMENLISEPQWILDRKGSGPLFWRRTSISRKNQRVKFRHDVEVLEFCRSEHEMETFLQQQQPEEQEESNTISMGMTAIVCLMVTVLLPWYLIGVE
ncbi:uncharacterized protein LOC108739385 [Agrilus planipennis]|uniref:Uncharacterized protein LOC108739385 n=1 Tax=Agrilus planipennis TaxID=224129 RepID=A0A1W4X7F9_AGRPL|nr:uncharacterized protein LOC108739385 [Agrilus planipennis]